VLNARRLFFIAALRNPGAWLTKMPAILTFV
jgi:hypothetical protein